MRSIDVYLSGTHLYPQGGECPVLAALVLATKHPQQARKATDVDVLRYLTKYDLAVVSSQRVTATTSGLQAIDALKAGYLWKLDTKERDVEATRSFWMGRIKAMRNHLDIKWSDFMLQHVKSFSGGELSDVFRFGMMVLLETDQS